VSNALQFVGENTTQRAKAANRAFISLAKIIAWFEATFVVNNSHASLASTMGVSHTVL
jgi:hypothetical protein